MSKTVNLADFIERYRQPMIQDDTYAVFAALEECRRTGAERLEIPEGEYHFLPDMAYEKLCFISNNDSGLKRVAFPIIGFKNFQIEANGSEFIFHGRVTPFIVENSENISISGFSIDYEHPLYAQGEIIDSSYDHLDVAIKKEDHPYKFFDGKLIFYSENWEGTSIHNFLEVDPATLAPAYRAGDDWAGPLVYAEEIREGVVRFRKKFNVLHKPGNIVVMSFEPRLCPGVFIGKSRNINLERINIYHAGAMGVIAQNTGNIRLNRVNVMLREGTRRVISANADATHFVNCYGSVIVEDCTLENQKDDPLNCHGIYTTVDSIVSTDTIIVKYHHPQQVGIDIYEPGDELTFINRESLLGYAHAAVKRLERINPELLRIELTGKLPESVMINDAVENRERMPELVVRNCRMGRNRARGMLITTPKKALIENNVIYSPGAGILIEGDANYWFESGAVNDVLIRNNDFVNCLYSPWGGAVIQVSPGVGKDGKSGTCFHKNIRIENNRFKAFDKSILSGCSVDGLTFSGNTVERTYTYEPYVDAEAMINLVLCRNIVVSGNRVTGFDGDKLVSDSASACENARIEP